MYKLELRRSVTTASPGRTMEVVAILRMSRLYLKQRTSTPMMNLTSANGKGDSIALLATLNK